MQKKNFFLPPDVPSDDVLRHARMESLDEDIGLNGPREITIPLMHLCSTGEIIQELSISPFWANYWLKEQIELYNRLSKVQPMSVTVDATGGLIRNLIYGELESSSIFLYQLLTKVNNQYASLAQRISSKHDTNSISYWMKSFFDCVENLPVEFISDGSLALLNGASLALNKCTYKFYLRKCLQVLLDDSDTRPFPCFLRGDRAHIIKTTTRWEHLKSV
ncbi:hypothetical protein TKK_0003238 [Trichogramma kaykai]